MDPDPGGPKTYGYYGSGSATLILHLKMSSGFDAGMQMASGYDANVQPWPFHYRVVFYSKYIKNCRMM
jgi:hypothetical protein